MAETVKTEGGAITTEEAMAVLQEQIEQRVATCKAEIDSVLDKHCCVLSVSMLVTQHGNKAFLKVEAKSS